MNPDFPEPTQMLRRHLIAHGLDALQAGAQRWAADRPGVRQQFAAYYGDLQSVLAATPLKTRVVGSGQGRGFRYENILFESHPGWEVNATLFLPADLPPPYPPIIMSVGHSAKTRPSYQLPCQYLARAGFAALTYDPPGMAGEKQPGNDHFADGVRCHLTGDTSSRYFVGDALRAVEYLLTRPDVDARQGVAATGVSGGGHTSIFAALLDDRITVIAPSCCYAPQAGLVLERSYSSCPETLMPGRLHNGLDDFDLCCALAPRPLLLMAGHEDEIFDIAETTREADRIAAHYAAVEAPGAFRFMADEGGHAYTLRQARVFAAWLRRHWSLPDTVPLPEPAAADFPLLEDAAMQCRPRTDVNMRSLTRDRAAGLAKTRPAKPTIEIIRRLNGIPDTLPQLQISARHPGQHTWFHTWSEWLVTTEPGITVPVTQVDPGKKMPALWHFDEAGRNAGLAHGGWLTEVIGHLDRDGPKACLLTADLRGRGETAMASRPFEAVNWGGPDRFAAYVGAALDDAPEAGRLRDAWQLAQAFPPRPRTVLSATGAAGPVALQLAALLPGRFAAVILHDAPASYAALLDTEEFAWPHDLVLPGVLRHYDLPDIAAITGCPVHWLNPRDGARRPIGSGTAINVEKYIALVRTLLHE